MADVINVTVTNGGTISADMTDATVVSTSVVSGGTVAASVIGGGKGEKGDKGDTGATGATGETGASGDAATVTAGTTTTGAAGSDASVTNSGSSSAAVFDFTIPRGATGATGAGFTGGSYNASTGKVTFTSSDGLGFVSGDLRGADGTDGAAATIAAGTTSTLAPGSSATVTNSGSSSAAVFDFGIPQGAVWYTGSGTPSTTHNDGDFYLNTSNGDVYKQTSGSWGSSIANLTGPTGSAGSASGSDTQVQFNDGGSFAGDAGLTYNKTTNALTISGDITANNLSGTNTGDQTTITGNAGTATKLTTARTIGGVSFDGSANIDLPGVNTTGNQDTSGNAATATKLATAREIAGQSFDGSADISIQATDLNLTGTASTSKYLRGDNQWVTPPNTTYSAMSVSEGETGTATTSRVVRADYLKTIIDYHVAAALSTMNADIQYGYPVPTS